MTLALRLTLSTGLVYAPPVVTRAQSAAATRAALLAAAAALLDAGGPQAVTLREVGSRAGVSRSAPYRHFADKDALVTALATAGWDDLGDALAALDEGAEPEQNMRAAVGAVLALGRARPHLYRLMYITPTGDPGELVAAAQRCQDLFIAVVAAMVGRGRAERSSALLLACAHGTTSLECSGNLPWQTWHATAEDLVDDLVALLSVPGQ